MSKFKKAINDMKNKRKKVANDIGFLVEAQAKANAPVLTGHMRRSTNAEVENKDDESIIFIGTNNVEYTAVVHEGSIVTGQQAQPYITDAIDQSTPSIKKMIKNGLK